MSSSQIIARSLGSADWWWPWVSYCSPWWWNSQPQSIGAAQAWYLTLRANNSSSECVLSAWGLGAGIVFFLGLWLGYLGVSKPVLIWCFAGLLECACVELEGSGVPPVRLTIPRGVLKLP